MTSESLFPKIKNRFEKELYRYAQNIDRDYALRDLSPLLSSHIKDFMLRDGKRIRPVLFCAGYLGFSGKASTGLYKSAISLELLHDFMLIHDDIIDNSDTRRGKPSMHAMLQKSIPKSGNIKFGGKDLAIVLGDIVYSMALDAFLKIKEEPQRKELALRKLISSALYTGSGEFIELVLGLKDIKNTTKKDIYNVYDYKTANYTFASPLAIGATLSGARPKEIDKLVEYGMCLGRGFQIKDDVIGTFGESSETGKSNLSDIREAKKTILIWHSYNEASQKDKTSIRKIFSMTNAGEKELNEIRSIMIKCGSLDYAKKEIKKMLGVSEKILASSRMRSSYKEALCGFSKKVLKL